MLEPLCSALAGLLPTQPALLQCGRYQQGDYIEPHDDAALVTVNGVEHSRDIAIVLHLSQLSLDDGGSFNDIAGGAVFAPCFNSLIAFRVPRLHEVTTMMASAPRYSIYGWFVAPG